MSEDIVSKRRRSVIKTIGGVATGAIAAGAVGTASAQSTKDHRIRFEIDNGDGSGQYSTKMPDPDPETENLEGEDDLETYSDYSYASGEVDGSWQPRYDEYRFDGDLSNHDWSADDNVTVIIDDRVVQG